MKFGLFLVGSKGQQVLESIVEDHNIEFVLSYDDKNVYDESFSTMKNVCENNGIKFYNGKKLPNDEYNNVDKIFVIGWQFMLNIFIDKLIVIHDSKLPEYKGWSPTVQYLIDGKSYLAATAFAPTMKMDTGNIYEQRTRDIIYPIKIEKAIKIVGELYVELVKHIIKNNPAQYEMTGDETFCVWRDSEDYFINWERGAEELKRFVDAVGFPFAGAKIKYNSTILTILDAEVEYIELMNKTPGKVWSIKDDIPSVITGSGVLKLTKIVDDEGNDFKFKKLKVRL